MLYRYFTIENYAPYLRTLSLQSCKACTRALHALTFLPQTGPVNSLSCPTQARLARLNLSLARGSPIQISQIQGVLEKVLVHPARPRALLMYGNY